MTFDPDLSIENTRNMENYVTVTLLSLAFGPAVLTFILVIFLASVGVSFGIRRLYIQVLLKIFEWGRQRIELEKRNEYEKREAIIDRTETKDPKQEVQENGDAGQDHTIEREVILGSNGIKLKRQITVEELRNEYRLDDIMQFSKSGVEAIIEDEVTHCFAAEELSSWNLLTRTNMNYQYLSLRLTVLWGLGCLVRYGFLLPFRLVLATTSVISLIISTAIIGYLPEGRVKQWLNRYLSLVSYRMMSAAFSAIITPHNRVKRFLNRLLSLACWRMVARALSTVTNIHNKEYRAEGGGICVANHTSPIDVIILSCDNCYAMVGQAQGGFLGMMQRAMARATAHIWFERSEVKDRTAVARRLREHVEDPNKLPILIFPEGTCVNNTSVLMFKKGSFEVGGKIYPVAIKYDPRFADAFWNSSRYSMLQHLVQIMSSWAIVCDIWYMPAQTLQEGETSVEFANRIKAQIAARGGLVDLEWDGQLKRAKPKATMKEKQQEEFSKRIKHD